MQETRGEAEAEAVGRTPSGPEPETAGAPGASEGSGPEAGAAAAGRRADAPRVLRRSRDDRIIAGVAGGLGRYLGIDPILIRIAFLLTLFLGGAGLVLYLLGWLAIPLQGEGEEVGGRPEPVGGLGASELVGLGLILLGVLFLVRLVLPDLFAWRYVWPVALILVGLLVLVRGTRR